MDRTMVVAEMTGFWIDFFRNIYLASPGLKLWHVGSSSLTRD